MNSQAREFFRTDAAQGEVHFCDARILSEEPNARWEELSQTGVPRGWFELSRVSAPDRVEFTRDFWLGRLPFNPNATERISKFFDSLDDVGVVICRQTTEEPWRAELIYSLADNSSFFRGLPPAEEEEIDWARASLRVELPRDYKSFNRIHNGFGKLTELGLISLDELSDTKERLLDQLLRADHPLGTSEQWINPYTLIPFYEVFGMGSYQCFCSEWYPGSEMGNLFYSGIDGTLSDVSERRSWAENLAYPTFAEWLAAFLEGVNTAS